MNTNIHLRELKVEVNRRCPLYCLHCSSNGQLNATETLDPHKLVKIINEFSQLGGKKIAITGGEPLLYENLALILRVCHTYQIETQLYTTGIRVKEGCASPLTDELLTVLAENEVKVVFSIHGARAETHDFLTQTKDSFKLTLNAIERALGAGIKVEIHFVPTSINFDEMEDVCKIVDSLNIRRISWLRFVPQGRGLYNRSLLQLTKAQLATIAKRKINFTARFPNLEIRTGAPFNILCPKSPAACMAGLNELVIRPDGRAVPCDAFKQFNTRDNHNNILEYSLLEIWQNSPLINAVRAIQQTKDTSYCSSCSSFSLCQSGCLAQKTLAAGILDNGTDPECLFSYVGQESGELETASVR